MLCIEQNSSLLLCYTWKKKEIWFGGRHGFNLHFLFLFDVISVDLVLEKFDLEYEMDTERGTVTKPWRRCSYFFFKLFSNKKRGTCHVLVHLIDRTDKEQTLTLISETTNDTYKCQNIERGPPISRRGIAESNLQYYFFVSFL
jgi:hypothetical protein